MPGDIQRAIDKQAKLEAEATEGPWKRRPINVRYPAGRDRQDNHNWNAIDGVETCTAEPHRGTSPYPDPFYIALPDAELIAHLRNQAPSARAVIEASMGALAILKEVAKSYWWDDIAGPGYGIELADELEGRLTAWADHVNGEVKP
jgi:hypothetical protein